MDSETGLERAMPFTFVHQLPRAKLDQVHRQEAVYDKQVLLNESWPHYCERTGRPEWILQEPQRDKWVTETWDEWEKRKRQQPELMNGFFNELNAREQEELRRKEARRAKSERIVEDIARREKKREESFLPALHTLLIDFDEKLKQEQEAERGALAEAEAAERQEVEREEHDAWKRIRDLERASLDYVNKVMHERQMKEEEENRRLEEQRQREREERERELEKQRLEKEAEEERRRKEEEAKAQEERDRKAAERKARVKAERERRRSKEEEAAQRRDSRRRSSTGRMGTPGSQGSGGRPGSASSLRDVRREEARGRRLQRQAAEMEEFLTKLEIKAAECQSLDDVLKLLGSTAAQLGDILFDCAIYIGLRQQDHLHYKFTSANCSAVLHAGEETLSISQHPDCPTVANVIKERTHVLVPDAVAAPPLGCPSIVRIGTKEGNGLGDFFSAPIFNSSGDVAAVLSADTIGELNQRQTNLTHDESSCYEGEKPLPPMRITEPLSLFLLAVARALSDAFTFGLTPQVKDARSLSELHATATSTLQDLVKGGNCYISTMMKPFGDEFTVVSQNGATTPGEVELKGHTNIIGKKLLKSVVPNAPSFTLGIASDITVSDVSAADSNAVPYVEGAAKRAEYLYLLPITTEYRGGEAVIGALGIEGPASQPLTEAQLRQIRKVGEDFNQRRRVLMKKRHIKQLSAQCAQWCSSLTGCSHCYVSLKSEMVKDDAPQHELTYVAATPLQKWVVGKTITTGVSFGVMEDKDPKISHISDVSKVPEVTYLRPDVEHSGQLIVAPIVCSGKVLGCLYLDTVGWTEGKRNFTQADLELVMSSAGMLADLLMDVEEGKIDDADDEQQLLIETEINAGMVRFLKCVWNHTVNELRAMKPAELDEIASYKSPPEAIPPVCASANIIMGKKPKAVATWDQCRQHMKGSSFIGRALKFDPTKKKPPRPFFLRAGKLIKGCTVDFVAKKGSKPVSIIFHWTYVNIKLRHAATKIRKLHAAGTLTLDDDIDDIDGEATTATEGLSTVGDDDDDESQDPADVDEDGGSAPED